jgi:hypothetical protein
MKSSAWDNTLWQNKMQEIPLERDADLAWSEMKGLLDEVMPVTPGSPVVKTPRRVPKSWVLIIVYAAAAAAIILLATHFLLKKQHQKTIKHNKENVKPADSHKDSLKQLKGERDSAINTPSTPGRVTADSVDASNTSAKNNVNNVNGKKVSGGNTANSPSKSHGILIPKTITGKPSLKYANSIAAIKGHNGAANSVSQTKGPATSPQFGAGFKHTDSHYFANKRGTGGNDPNSYSGATTTHVTNAGANQNKNMLADGNASKTNGLIKPNSSSAKKGNKPANGVPVVSAPKPDSTKMAVNGKKVNSATKPVTTVNNGTLKNNPSAQSKPGNNRQHTYSKFGIAIESGVNSGKGSATPFAGLYGFYALTPQFSISIGGNIFSSRIIRGKYSIGNYQYTTQDDSGHITSHTANGLFVTTSQKISTIEIPLIASYKLTKWLSIKGGPVISVPIKADNINNILSPVGSPLDTARAFKALSSTVNSTSILNKVNFNLSGGVLINIDRLYFDASYVQGTGPYTTYSSLGSGNTYYHYLQLGIGYKLFQSKPKLDHR